MRRPKEQREVAFGMADLSTHPEVHVRMVQKGGCKSLVQLLERSADQAGRSVLTGWFLAANRENLILLFINLCKKYN